MELNNLNMIEKDVIDYNLHTSHTSKTSKIPDISSLNKEQFDNYKNLLYKKYNILTKIYKIPKLDINEPFIVTHNKYYRYINLLNDK
jgi:hypothetical protein